MDKVTETLTNLAQQTAFATMSWGNVLMIVIACIFLYLAIKKGYEPLLLVPIAYIISLHWMNGVFCHLLFSLELVR